jgi:Fe-S oxidoreductase
MIENVIDTIENCRFCLMCRHVAPVGHVTAQEALTPHGVALLASSQRRGLIDWTAETVDVIYSEVDGGNSRVHCVNSLPFEESIAAVRAELVAQGLAPTAVTTIQQKLAQWQTPYAEQSPQPVTGTGDIALFVGDEAAYLQETTLPAVLRLLNAVGVEPVLVGNGRNNGLLAQTLGFPELAQTLIQSTLDEIASSGAKTLLVLSAGDTFVFNQMMSERLGVERPSDLQIVEVTRYLAQSDITFTQIEDDVPTAYVDPTHAVRVADRHDGVRGLVTAVYAQPLRELFWRRERAHPVGSTHLQFSNPALAEQLTRARLQDAQNVGVKRVVCEDVGTLWQLGRFADEYGIQIQGLYELLAAQLN